MFSRFRDADFPKCLIVLTLCLLLVACWLLHGVRQVKGQVELASIIAVRLVPPVKVNRAHAFEVDLDNGTTRVLAADSEDEARWWVSKLVQATQK